MAQNHMKSGLKLLKKYQGSILLAIGIILMIAGIFTDEAELVLEKATRICLECIGIG